jgi:hypothetical protein
MSIWIWVYDICWVLDPMGMGIIFYLCVTFVSDLNRDGYGTSIFFPPAGNLTGTRYFSTDIILGCEQVKMCSFYYFLESLFCYINYDLF